MLPHLAQGGVLALEDALVLAACLARNHRDEPSAFKEFEIARRRRTAAIAAQSRRNGSIYHLGGPLAWVRDGVLRLVPGARMMAAYDWIYGWQPPGSATERVAS
jgi:salicylate hydroxylase